jgi:hypothetical protein
MTVFVQKFKDGRTNKYEVFRRSTAPEDSTLAVEETRQAAIATAGQLATDSEAIRESADQNDFGIIRDGDVAPGPGDNPGTDPAGGFFESVMTSRLHATRTRRRSARSTTVSTTCSANHPVRVAKSPASTILSTHCSAKTTRTSAA